jgi:hypothetical protein
MASAEIAAERLGQEGHLHRFQSFEIKRRHADPVGVVDLHHLAIDRRVDVSDRAIEILGDHPNRHAHEPLLVHALVAIGARVVRRCYLCLAHGFSPPLDPAPLEIVEQSLQAIIGRRLRLPKLADEPIVTNATHAPARTRRKRGKRRRIRAKLQPDLRDAPNAGLKRCRCRER